MRESSHKCCAVSDIPDFKPRSNKLRSKKQTSFPLANMGTIFSKMKKGGDCLQSLKIRKNMSLLRNILNFFMETTFQEKLLLKISRQWLIIYLFIPPNVRLHKFENSDFRHESRIFRGKTGISGEMEAFQAKIDNISGKNSPNFMKYNTKQISLNFMLQQSKFKKNSIFQ